jgi:hypothetical protein
MKGKIMQINTPYVHWKLKEAMNMSAENIMQHHTSHWKHFTNAHKISA